MTVFNIAVLGECMVELQEHGEFLKKTMGGDTLNTATYTARLTHENPIEVSYVTALGTDTFSEQMLNQWQKDHINTDLVLRLKNKQPGLYLIETDNTGERTFHYWRNDSAAKYIFDQPESPALLEKLYHYDALYLSGITLAILTEHGREALFAFLDKFQEKGGVVIFDNNYRPKLWESQEIAQKNYLAMLAKTNIALLTFDDEQDLYSDKDIDTCIKRTQEAGVKEIIIKRGSQDCLIVTSKGQVAVTPNHIDNVVDTTAAGDSFSAGYLAKRFCGGSPAESAQVGHDLAGTVIQYPGAVIPNKAMPNIKL